MRKQREITRLTLHRGDSPPASSGEFLAAIDSQEDNAEDIRLMISRNFPVETFKKRGQSVDKLIEEVIAVAVSAYAANQKLKGLRLDEPLTTELPIKTKFLPAQSLVRAERRLQP